VKLEQIPAPVAGPGQVRVTVKATALNRADLLQTMGLYPPPPGIPPELPGMEFAGQIDALGEGVTGWKVGDRVMGLVGGAAWADQLVTVPRELLRIPDALSFAEAAAIPEAFITAFDALTLQGGMKAGHTVLIHAVSSGVGTAAVQWAHLTGAKTVGTSRTAAKLERTKPLGLDVSLLQAGPTPSFADQVQADVVLELVGGAYFAESVEALKPHGRLILVGLTGGLSSEVSLQRILSKRLRIQGTTMRSREAEEKGATVEAFAAQVLPHFASGRLKPVIGATVSFEQLPQALKQLAANETFGKTVVTL
jgi:NADPH:quinone reductase-like Zn-dependent oxidoreductase